MSKNEPTATIPVENLPVLREKLEKLNRKAEKLGLDVSPITLTEGERHETQYPGEEWVTTTVDVFVEGASPKLNGWQFVATLEHDESGTLIRRFPLADEAIDLTQYRTATPDNCDHCHARRRRNDTYIVAKLVNIHPANAVSASLLEEAGPVYETAQVGSTCLKDFIGHASPQQIAKWLESLRDTLEQSGDRGERIERRYYLDSVLEVAADEVNRHGYVSRKVSQETGQDATADQIGGEFFHRMNTRDHLLPLDPGTIDIAKVTEWVRSLDEKALENEYLYNLFTVCRNDTITTRQFGIAASAITAYQREEAKRIERTSGGNVDEYLAEPGEKIEVTFTVERIFTNEDVGYGISYYHVLRASTGHRLAWTTKPSLEQGKTYSGGFKVKANKETKGGKNTVIYYPRNLKEI